MGKHKRELWSVREELARVLFDQAEVIDYETIKQIGSRTQIKVDELITQTVGNDPFYAGSPKPREMAEWLAEHYHTRRWGTTHIRRCHYQLVSLGVWLPNGEKYINTEQHARLLYETAKVARYLHLIPIEALEDHRNDAAINYHPLPLEEEEKIAILNGRKHRGWYEDIELPDFPELPEYTLENVYDRSTYDALQPYHLEIWCEKSTMNDILLPLCQQYRLSLQTALGEMSLYAVHKLARRIKRYDKPTRILYLSDHDVSGNNMPVSMGNKLEWCLRDLQMEEADVRLFPLVLTKEQIQHYNLPGVPLKDTLLEFGHGRRFEEKHGENGAVELDALEALHPGELRKIMKEAILTYYDTDLWEEVRTRQQEIKERLEEEQEEVYAVHQQEIDEQRDAYQEIMKEFEEKITDCNQRIFDLYVDVTEKLQEKAKEIKLDEEYPMPESKEAEELDDGLYNSRRGHYDQVVVFKQYQGKYDSDYSRKKNGELITAGIGWWKQQDILEQEQAVIHQQQQEQEQCKRLARVEEITTAFQSSISKKEKGMLLLEAKTLLGADWAAWRDQQCSLPTARKYMQLAENEG
jgi:Txe/YoeB family toxin of Txe-Axe toxin-antitoxin module/Mg2+ and Co2+ transporter CorA